jgi:hypothetical protein
MRFGEALRKVALAAVALGLGAGLVTMVGGCAAGREGSTEPEASQGGQAVTQPQLPSLDREAPRSFQTASFALG